MEIEREYIRAVVKKLDEIKEKIKPVIVNEQKQEVDLSILVAPLEKILVELKKKEQEEIEIEVSDELIKRLPKPEKIDYEKIIEAVVKDVLSQIKIDEPEVVNLEPIYKKLNRLSLFIEKTEFNVFKEKVDKKFNNLNKEIIDFLLGDKEFLFEINKRLPKKNFVSGGGSGGGVTKLEKLKDVNLSNLEKDEDGKYILGGGSSFFEADNYDFTDDYVYYGFINKDDEYQINRRSTHSPYEKTTAIGEWDDRLTLTYE